MPVLNACGNVYDVAGVQLAGRLAPFLIVATATGDEQNLAAALICVMDMLVVAAARFKGYVADNNLVEREHIQIALTDEILCISIVFCACREYGFKLFFRHLYTPFKF